MYGVSYLLIVCMLVLLICQEQNINLSCKGRLHLE